MRKKLQGKRILSLLLSILLLLSVCPFSASAHEGVTFELLSGTSAFVGEDPENIIDGDKTTRQSFVEGVCTAGVQRGSINITPSQPANGDGTAENPYALSTAEELYWFAALVNGELEGVEQNASANAVLINDITVNEGNVSGCGGVKQDGWCDWTPIAYGNTRQYSGSFDGCGYTVSGLYYKSTTMNYVGLFGKVQNGTVSNVSVENSYFHGYKYVGGVCGSIVNSVSEAEVNISSCFNDSTVKAEVEAAGGVVGYVNNTSAGSNATITFFNCRNTGSVALTGSSTSYHAGGVIGYVNNMGTGATVTVTSCYNEGSITAAGSSSKRIGGVCGRVDKAIISDCYNLGTVTANGSRSQDVGGVCGYVYKAGAAVQNCYSFGSVSAPSANNKNTGGVAGYVSGGTVDHCYYLDSAAAKGIGSGSGSTESKTEKQFASGEVAYLLEEYAGDSTWGQVIGMQDYPTLSDAKVYLVSGSYSNHDATAFEGKPATCTETGRQAYWYCPECDKYFSNAECTVETTLEAIVITALGHSYGYTDNGNGTHTATCSACGDTFTEDHTFTDGVCVCGAVKDTETILDGAISIGQQLFLESNLTMSFRIKESQLNNYDISTAYLVIEQDTYPSSRAMYAKTETLTGCTVENDRLVFQYRGIAASQMNDEIRVTLHIKDSSGKEYVSNTLTTSVTAYVKQLLDAFGTTNAKLCTVLMDMLNYGTAAQLYFDRHADAPANTAYAEFADYASYASAEFVAPLEDLSSVITNEGATATMNLTVELATQIGIVYKVTLPKGVNAADATVVVKDADGNELETLSLSDATVDTKGQYAVTYFGTPSRLMRRVVYGTVYVDGAAISNTYGYSISTYAYQIANTADIPEALVNLTNLMVMYGDAANAYFGG